MGMAQGGWFEVLANSFAAATSFDGIAVYTVLYDVWQALATQHWAGKACTVHVTFRQRRFTCACDVWRCIACWAYYFHSGCSQLPDLSTRGMLLSVFNIKVYYGAQLMQHHMRQ